MFFTNFSEMIKKFTDYDELPSTIILELCKEKYPEILGSVADQQQNNPNFQHQMLTTHLAATTDIVINSYIPYGIKNELIIAALLYRTGEPDVCRREYSQVYGKEINIFKGYTDFSHAKAKQILSEDGSIGKIFINDILTIIDHYEDFENYYTQDDFECMNWLSENTDNIMITQNTVSEVINQYDKLVTPHQWMGITFLMEADARAQAQFTRSHSGVIINSRLQKIDRAIQIRYEIAKHFNL